MVFFANIVLFGLVCFLIFKFTQLKERLEGFSFPDMPYLMGMSRIIDAFEAYEKPHAVKMALLAEKIAREIGLPEETVFAVKVSANLHDCGELNLPKEIFKSERKLSNDEWFLIQAHPIIGETTLRKTVPLNDEVPSLVRWHHEKWDGTGYPDQLTGNEIPIGARILGIVDAISAMSHDRPYRKALSRSKILEELKRLSGFHFDPEIVLEILEKEIDIEC